jgi:hypothetical protein
MQIKMALNQDYLHCQVQTFKGSTMGNFAAECLQLFQKGWKLAHLHAQTKGEKYKLYFDKKAASHNYTIQEKFGC